MKTHSTDDTELFERALRLLAETRLTLAKELSARRDDIEHGNARGLSWKDLERELSDASWS